MTDYIGFDSVADGPRPGLEGLVRAVELATGRRVWNLGTWVVRNKRRPDGTDLGTTSVHATGRAADLSRRAMDGRRIGCDRATFAQLLDNLADQADRIGLQALIDYEGKRVWRCDRAAWRTANVQRLDAAHLELDPQHADTTDWIPAAIIDLTRQRIEQTQITYPGQVIKRNSKRTAAVRRIQQALNAAGAELVVDGRFGPLTERAVKLFQGQRGLVVDGIVGPITWSALF